MAAKTSDILHLDIIILGTLEKERYFSQSLIFFVSVGESYRGSKVTEVEESNTSVSVLNLGLTRRQVSNNIQGLKAPPTILICTY